MAEEEKEETKKSNKFTWQGNDWYIDGYLASQLDNLIFNIEHDWDFVILITGDRMVRVGKSKLAQTIAGYLAMGLQKRGLNKDAFNINNILFESKKIIDSAMNLPRYSVIIYDEARESMSTSKASTLIQKQIIDFFTECGQLNHIFIVVAPDFFELKEYISVGRSECLINVYRRPALKENIDLYKDGEKRDIVFFHRGFFQFFSRNKKALLFDVMMKTRQKNYNLVKADFVGRFTDQCLIDDVAYRKLKEESLENARYRAEIQMRKKKTDVFRDDLIFKLRADGLQSKAISKFFMDKYQYEITDRQINSIISAAKKKKEKELLEKE